MENIFLQRNDAYPWRKGKTSLCISNSITVVIMLLIHIAVHKRENGKIALLKDSLNYQASVIRFLLA